MIKVGVIGSTGYTGRELVEVLLRNPEVKITALTSSSDKEVKYTDLNPRVEKKISVKCKKLDVKEISKETDLVFLALPHNLSMEVAPKFIEAGVKVIDLSADYRLPPDLYENWYKVKHSDEKNLPDAVYGLPELNRDKIKDAHLVANPGCYPSTVILGLLPIAKLVAEGGHDVIVDSKSGVTGAGRKAHVPLMFGEVSENFKCYKPNDHQHIPEMEYILSGAAEMDLKVNFIPHLLPIKRGILSTIYFPHKSLPSEDKLYNIYKNHYFDEPFVRLKPLGEMPEIKDVSGTNFCDIGIKVARGMVIIVSVIDNLLKGAAGQAVQNMNIMYKLDEKLGLN